MNEKIQFLIVENLPRDGHRVDLKDTVYAVLHDLHTMDSSCEKEEIHKTFESMHEKQFVFMFSDGTVALTEYGNRMLS